MKSASMPVTPITGHSALTRIRQGASSTASDFETRLTAPFEALYHVSPGRGRIPAVEPTFSITPPPLSRIRGTALRTMWKIDLTLTAMIRSKAASSTSRIGRFRCVTPALLTMTCGTPKASTVRATAASTAAPTDTSASRAIAASPIDSATRAA